MPASLRKPQGMGGSMNFRLLRLVALFAFVSLLASAAFAEDPDVIKTSKHDTSRPLSQMVGGKSIQSGSNGQTPNARATCQPFNNPHSDVVAAPFAGPLNSV